MVFYYLFHFFFDYNCKNGFVHTTLLPSNKDRKGGTKGTMDTKERIKKLFIDKIDVKEDSLGPDVTLDSLGLDSLDKIELLFALEEEFQIKIDDRSKAIATVRDVVTLIDSLVAEQQPAAQA